MNDMQKMGGIAAWIHSAAYLVGIVMYFAVLSPIIDAEPSQYLAQFAEYQNVLYSWILVAYWVAGFCLVIVALALYERLKSSVPAVMQISTALGLIWASLIIGSGNMMMHGFIQVPQIYADNPAQAETVSLALGIVENGLISGNELIGGLWISFLSWSALQAGKLGKGLNYFGMFIGLAGIVSIIPPFTEMALTIFGLSMIVWFAWAGVVLLRSHSVEQPRQKHVMELA